MMARVRGSHAKRTNLLRVHDFAHSSLKVDDLVVARASRRWRRAGCIALSGSPVVTLPPAATEPLIKCSYFAGTLASLSVLGETHQAVARARVASIIKDVQQRLPNDWLPLHYDVELTNVVHELAGDAGVVQVNRAAFVLGLSAPLLKPIATAAVNLFGLSPRGLMRAAAAGWSAGTRHVGAIVVERSSDGEVIIVHRDLPSLVRRDRKWQVGFLGICEGVLEITKTVGKATTQHFDDGDIAQRVRLTWSR